MNLRELAKQLPRFEGKDERPVTAGEMRGFRESIDRILRNADTLQPIVSANGNVLIGDHQLDNDATRGFIYMPRFQGPPTGTPQDYNAGSPYGYDELNDVFYIYDFADAGWKPFGMEDDSETVLWLLILLELERIAFA